MAEPVYYHDYLQLEQILNAQHPESDRLGAPVHDEHLFIVIHQAYELWFKQLKFELNAVLLIMSKPTLHDHSPELQTVVHRLSRMVTILRVLVQQIDIMETMTPMDFLDFRDLLRPASGFQSVQFKEIEALLGLRFEDRHGQQHYKVALRKDDLEELNTIEQRTSLLALTGKWLERMPFFEETELWSDFSSLFPHPDPMRFWKEYEMRYSQSLAQAESSQVSHFQEIILNDRPDAQLSSRALRAALFVLCYREYPVLQLPFHVLQVLLEIDEQLSNWRYRHMNMVHRIIGTRIGTGGSSGRDYLRSAAEKHYIFREIAQLNSFLMERKRLPDLPFDLKKRLGL